MDYDVTLTQSRHYASIKKIFPVFLLFSRFVGILAARLIPKDIFSVTHTIFLYKFYIEKWPFFIQNLCLFTRPDIS